MMDEEDNLARKRPISLLSGSCSDSSEDSDPRSATNSDSSSSCSATDDKRRYCFLKRAARQMVMVISRYTFLLFILDWNVSVYHVYYNHVDFTVT